MKLNRTAIIIGSALLTLLSVPADATFVPENEIRYESLTKGPSQVTQEDFNSRIAQLQKTYEGAVSRFGGKLSIEGSWNNEKIVAQAAQMFGTWKIQFSGGLARRPELTGDGMTLIICHEMGHLIGGFPFAGGNPFVGTGMANEGEADYFSTHVCAKKLWGPESVRNAEFRQTVSRFAKEKCDQVYSTQSEQDLCYRSAVGAESVIATMAGLKNEPMAQFETPDPAVVTATNPNHPATQCRMDTTFQGAICSAYFNELIIPGKNAKGGASGVEAEKEAAMNSCTALSNYTIGLRPLCWFKPRM
jgi:hypothetical protein